jgi:hypothetical protein
LQLVYDVQLGGADDAALQEAALRQRGDRSGTTAGLSPGRAAALEASLAAKSTASGLVKDIKFLDLESCFWQIARQHWLQYGASDDSTIPQLGGCFVVAGLAAGWVLHDSCNNMLAKTCSRPDAVARLPAAVDRKPCCKRAPKVVLLLASCYLCRQVQGAAGQALASDGLRKQGGALAGLLA